MVGRSEVPLLTSGLGIFFSDIQKIRMFRSSGHLGKYGETFHTLIHSGHLGKYGLEISYLKKYIPGWAVHI